MSSRSLLLIGLLIAVTGFTALSLAKRDAPPQTRLLITGSSTIAPLAAEIAKRYEAENPHIRIDVETGGSSRGLADARKGLADIGMISRALKDSDTGVVGHLIARDGIAMIVHAENAIDELNEAQIRSLYRNEINNWAALGGADGPVTIVHKAEGRSTLEVFLDHFDLANGQIVPDIIIGDNEQGIKSVAGNPTAIGYVSIGAAEIAIANGVPIRLLTLQGIEASTAHIADGSFPITRELNFVTGKKSGPDAIAFLKYAQSGAADDLIKDLSFVPPHRR